jgi:hypothetical protein
MNSALEQELTGSEPVTVKLGGKEYPLGYPMHAVILYKQLTGDNLFQGGCWNQIAPMEDPERFIACLFAGLQTYDVEHDRWDVPLTRSQIESFVDFGNANELVLAIARALTRFFPKAKPEAQGESQLPATAAAGSDASPSPNSGPAPATTSS